MQNWEEIKKESIRVCRELVGKNIVKTENDYIGKWYEKNSQIKDFEIFKVKKFKGGWKIELAENADAWDVCTWLNFWNNNDYCEISVFENCFLTIGDEAYTIEQMKELQANGNLVYENRYEKGKKSFGIVKNNEHFSVEKIKWLNFWNGEQLAQDIQKVNFNSLQEIATYVEKNQGKYYYDTYKKGVLK